METFTSEEDKVLNQNLAKATEVSNTGKFTDHSCFSNIDEKTRRALEKLIAKNHFSEIPFTKTEYYYHFLLADYYLKQFRLSDALFHFKDAYFHACQYDLDDTVNLKSHSLLSIALCYKYKKDYVSSLHYLSKLKNTLSIGKDIVFQLLLVEASIYTSIGNYSEALVLYQDLLNKSDSLKLEQLSSLNISLSAFYRETGNLLLSDKHLSLAHHRIPENLEPLFLLELSKLCINKKDFSSAIKHLSEAYLIVKSQSCLELSVELLFCLAVSYFQSNEYTLALEKLEIAKALLVKTEAPLLKAELYSLFAEIHLSASDYKKYQCYIKKIKLL